MKTCPWCGCTDITPYIKLKDYFLSGENFDVVECSRCHLLFTDPRPHGEEASKYYKSENYLSHQENTKGFIPRVYEFVKSYNLKNKANMASQDLSAGKVLDIGCGVGDFLLSMQRLGWSVMGIEPSPEARHIADKRLGFEPLTPDDYELLPDHSFDLITLWHVLEHVDDLHNQVSQLQRLLKPGGRLLLALPNFKSFDAFYYQQYWAAWDVPRHLNHFYPGSIHSIFDTTPFKLIDIQKLRWDAYYISYLSETYKHHTFPLIRGAFVGLRSNIKARRSGMYSSLVYRFKLA